MRDSRVPVWTTVTISADGDTTGPEIDLLEQFVGDFIYGTEEYGVPVELIADDVVTGTGNGFTVTMKWQVAPDDGSGAAGTYVDFATIGVFRMDTDGLFLKEDNSTLLGLDRAKLQTRLKGTVNRFARLVATAASVTGGETVRVRGWLSDGVHPYIDPGKIY